MKVYQPYIHWLDGGSDDYFQEIYESKQEARKKAIEEHSDLHPHSAMHEAKPDVKEFEFYPKEQ